jgi:hypothetical protein
VELAQKWRGPARSATIIGATAWTRPCSAASSSRLSQRYSVSDDALGRHRKHMQVVIAKAVAQVEQKELAYGSALLAEIGRIRADA